MLRFQADNRPVVALAAPLVSNTLPLKLLARAACFTALAFLDVLFFRQDNCFSPRVTASAAHRGKGCCLVCGSCPLRVMTVVHKPRAIHWGRTEMLPPPPWCYLCLLCIPIIYCLAMCSAFCLATLSSCAVQLPTGVTKPLEPQITNNREPHLSLELLPRLNKAFACSAELCLVIFMRATRGNIWGRYLWSHACGKR